jgi:MFS family permease
MHFGRRKMLINGCFFIFVGGAGQSATYHIASIMIFRIITGIGTGLISSTVPVWISEISDAAIRGRMVAFQLTIVLSGNVTAYWIDYGTPDYSIHACPGCNANGHKV